MYNILKETIEQLNNQIITEERKIVLQPLIDSIQEKINLKETVNLNFICTHNSRRSHFSQIWAQTLAYYFKVPNVNSYSGGTEATSVFPKVIEILSIQGFSVSKLNEGDNPVYAIKYSSNGLPIIGFSKKYDNIFNPDTCFFAIMTCSSADEGCPLVKGAEKRFSIQYDDPKEFDNTNIMDNKYKLKSIEIATEMYYVFSNLKV
ncbi:Protein tyrosine phosphatase [Flavobacterium sp. 9AF]|uniref:protein-tyrosine-phosphatase n=1 Tax=Flavobacterium sp. 9AF TaxID=2653142 RepID=UPI0012F29753|nr:protein-tyrosine-phosphatase [Flavobacterium sp. 9AF]VXA96615.1 Protein tyrosine phosphatase [Flavobacterium sp. 9AF]